MTNNGIIHYTRIGALNTEMDNYFDQLIQVLIAIVIQYLTSSYFHNRK